MVKKQKRIEQDQSKPKKAPKTYNTTNKTFPCYCKQKSYGSPAALYNHINLKHKPQKPQKQWTEQEIKEFSKFQRHRYGQYRATQLTKRNPNPAPSQNPNQNTDINPNNQDQNPGIQRFRMQTGYRTIKRNEIPNCQSEYHYRQNMRKIHAQILTALKIHFSRDGKGHSSQLLYKEKLQSNGQMSDSEDQSQPLLLSDRKLVIVRKMKKAATKLKGQLGLRYIDQFSEGSGQFQDFKFKKESKFTHNLAEDLSEKFNTELAAKIYMKLQFRIALEGTDNYYLKQQWKKFHKKHWQKLNFIDNLLEKALLLWRKNLHQYLPTKD